jgi:aspartyl-tRNA synthetase
MAETKQMKRRIYCGEVDDRLVGRSISVYGWVNNKRELGAITFIDLRDRSGILQVMVNDSFPQPELARKIGKEFVLAVTGQVARRAAANPDLPTGTVELVAESIEILAESDLPPFFPENRDAVSEELRFRHRYLDLRNLRMQANFRMRSEVSLLARQFLHDNGFLEIETPVLGKATPEGARDYLVPSRVYKGKMFALPQSPQLFKQMLMISGFERYYQLARCFRDEDLRADRQPEFTQVDIEMSFAEPEDIFALMEDLMVRIWALRGVTVRTPFRRMPYAEAMAAYGSDKPDLRIPFRIRDFTDAVTPLGSPVLDGIVAAGSRIQGLVVDGAAAFSRKKIDELTEFVRSQGGAGLIWMRNAGAESKSSLKVTTETIASFFRAHEVGEGQMVFLVGARPPQDLFLAGRLREHLGREFQKPGQLEFLWVVDFPLFSWNEEEKRYDSNHHPFTSPRVQDIPLLDTDPLRVQAVAYDLVLNGTELGGGSRRIHDIGLQRKIFQLINLGEAEIEEKFGWFLNALRYGAPPHLGIALGLDRLMMLLLGADSIREMIAFPKTTSSLCLLSGSPSAVSNRQLDELGIETKR